MGKEKNEELQSRRDFFKKAAKSALPILGAIAIASTPLLANASVAGRCTTCQGASCGITCSGICRDNCAGGCKETCMQSCKNGCHKHGK